MQVGRKVFRESHDESSGLLATGHPSGCIYFWRNRVVMSTLQAYDTDPKWSVEIKGCPSFVIGSPMGVRCIRVWCMHATQDQPWRNSKLGADHSIEAQRWCFAASGQEGAVHIWGITADGSSSTKSRKALNRETASIARRIVSLWLPRHMAGPSRSAVRAFDVQQSPCGNLSAVIGAYDGTIWMCTLDLDAMWQVCTAGGNLHEMHVLCSVYPSLPPGVIAHVFENEQLNFGLMYKSPTLYHGTRFQHCVSSRVS